MKTINEPMIVAAHTEEYIRKTMAPQTGLLSEIAKIAEERRIPIISPETAKYLEVTVKSVRPSAILEIGTAIGYSAIIMAQAAEKDVGVDTIESDYDSVIEARDNIQKAGLSNRINVVYGDAAEVLPSLRRQYDLIFLDGPKGQYLRLLPDCVRLLKNKGLLITDNTFYRGMIAVGDTRIPVRRRTMVRRLREYLKVLCEHSELDTCLIPMSDGMAVSVKKEKEHE